MLCVGSCVCDVSCSLLCNIACLLCLYCIVTCSFVWGRRRPWYFTRHGICTILRLGSAGTL